MNSGDPMLETVNMTKLRPMLSAAINAVLEGDQLVITKRGRKVAALVPYPELRRIWDAVDEEDMGPINPDTGKRYGRQWVVENFGGRYLRTHDPDQAQRPRKSEAPWVGHSFEWPKERKEPDPARKTAGSRKPVEKSGPRVRGL
jgi:prevent-host-death family protein